MEQVVEEKKKFELVWNKDKHVYEIATEVEKELNDFISKCLCREVSVIENGEVKADLIPFDKIEDDETKKMVWKKRTELNKKAKEIADTRKKCVAIMINGFVEVCKSMESRITEASNQLTKLLDEYEPKEVKEKPIVYKLVIKTESLSTKKKIEEIALSMGCEVSE